MYSFTGRIRYSETGADGTLTPEKLIDYFQDCSTFQAEDLEAGVMRLRGQGLAWIIVYWRVEIRRLPALGENVRVGTFPYSMKGGIGLRNFFMETERGERLASANSVWSLVDTASMRPVRIPAWILGKYKLEKRLDMLYDSRKIQPPGLPGIQLDPVRVREHHLDSNRHMNNGQYVRIAAGFLPPECGIRTLRIEYRQQAVLGDFIVPVLYAKTGGQPGYGSSDVSGAGQAEAGPDESAAEDAAVNAAINDKTDGRAEYTGSQAQTVCIALNAADGRPYAILEAEVLNTRIMERTGVLQSRPGTLRDGEKGACPGKDTYVEDWGKTSTADR